MQVIYPAADFRIGGTRFCNAGPNHSYLPAIGDEIIVFAYGPPIDSDRTFLHTDPDQLFFQSGKKLIIPPALAADAALRQASLLEHVERAVEPRQKPGVRQ